LLDVVSGAVGALCAPVASRGELGDQELAAGVARAREELNALYSQMYEESQSARQRRGAASWRETLRAKEAELESLENRLSAQSRSEDLLAPPATLQRVQVALRPEQLVVEYFSAAGETLALAIARDSAQLIRSLAPTKDIEQQVERVAFQLGRATRPAAMD